MCGFLADSLKSVHLYPCNLIIRLHKRHACLTAIIVHIMQYCASAILLVHSRNAVGGPELMVLSCANTYIVLQTIGAVVIIRQTK